jgi:hypothetical protein
LVEVEEYICGCVHLYVRLRKRKRKRTLAGHLAAI